MNTMLRKFNWHRFKHIYLSFKCTLYIKKNQWCSFQVGCFFLSSLIKWELTRTFLGFWLTLYYFYSKYNDYFEEINCTLCFKSRGLCRVNSPRFFWDYSMINFWYTIYVINCLYSTIVTTNSQFGSLIKCIMNWPHILKGIVIGNILYVKMKN